MPVIQKPVVGQPGWSTPVDAVIDAVNDLEPRVAAVESGASIPDATTSVKGKSRILGGTADAPTVPWSAITSKPTIPATYAELTGSVPTAALPIGTGAAQVAAGDDSRIAGAMQRTLNLSDLVSTENARANLGLGSVNNTSDAGKPVSTAQLAALNLKAPLASPTFTGTVSGVTRAHVGLGSVDNTSDADKPVSAAQQSALNFKAPLASPTFTGTVSGITRAHVGLGNVDNTSDANKPVSAAQQAALDLKVSKGTLYFNPMDYGAVGDGITNDIVAIHSAAAAAFTAGGGTVVLTRTHFVNATTSLPAGVNLTSLRGSGAGLVVPAGFGFSVIKVDALVGGKVSNIVIKKAAGANAVAGGYGIYVVGNSDGVKIVDVLVEGASTGFYVAGQAGAVPGTAEQIIIARCRANNSAVYGFEVDECKGVTIVDCQSRVSGLDGVKLRRNTHNVQLRGGVFIGAIAGDGLDAYAGGESFSIIGGEYSNNAHNGIVVKNDLLNTSDPGIYGIVKNVTITGVIAKGNGGSGVTCHRSGGNPDNPTLPLVARYSLTGGIYSGNGNYGIYLLARQIVLAGVACSRNGRDGIYLEPACSDVTILGAHVAGNGISSPGSYDGLRIAGNRIQILGGSSIGADPDAARDEADVAAGTRTQRWGMRIEAGTTNVQMHMMEFEYNLLGSISDLSGCLQGPQTGANEIYPGRYLGPEGSRTTVTMTANVEYAVPVWISNEGDLVRLGLEIMTAGTEGTKIRLGVRRTLWKMPGPVLGEVTVTGDVLGAVEAIVAIPLGSPGLYFFTATAQACGPQLPIVRGTTGDLPGVTASNLATALSASPLSGYITAATTTDELATVYVISNRAGAAPRVVARG